MKIATRAEAYLLLGAAIGIGAGLYWFQLSWSEHVTQIRAERPDAPICGNPALGGIGIAFVFGGLGGGLVGGVCELLSRK